MSRSTDTAATSGFTRWIRWTSTIGLVSGVIALLAMLLAGPVYRVGWLDLGPAFGLLRNAVWLGAAAAAISLLAFVLALFGRITRYRLRAALGIALGLLAIAPPVLLLKKAKSVPPIHDISTDTADPPLFRALLPQRAATPNPPAWGGTEVAKQQHAAYPDIQPLHFDEAPTPVFDAALATAEAIGWKIAAQVPAEGRIEATASTIWFGFKDDIVIRVHADGAGSRLDIRSQSRIGKSDLGANAARIRVFRERLRKRVGATS